jgi:hypothetical protein
MPELRNLRVTIEDFEKWLRDRGYDEIMQEENFRIFLDIGLAGLLFSNSSLLINYILNKLNLPSERLADRVRFEIGRRIREIKVGRDYLEIAF